MATVESTPGRVVLIAGTDPGVDLSGHRTYVRAHALAAAAAGFSPHVFIVARERSVQRTAFGTLHRIRSPLHAHTLLAAAHEPLLATALTRHLASEPGPHLIHSFGAWAGTGARVIRALARRGVSAVAIASAYTTLDHEAGGKRDGLVTDHELGKELGYRVGHQWVRLVASPAERRGYRGSRLVLVNYESVRGLVRRLCGPEVEIRRLPYAAPSAFEPARARGRAPEALAALSPSDAPLIVSVSRHDPRKGIDVLLHALAGLAAAGVEFRACLLGLGPLLDAHRALAAELGLLGRVAIPGWVDDALDYLGHADVFVLPSREEGSGAVALLEALQAGAAVVASRCDGIPEDVVDERDALLVAPGDHAALEAALARLLGDPALRARLQARGQAVYEERFSAPALVCALTGLYAELGFLPGT